MSIELPPRSTRFIQLSIAFLVALCVFLLHATLESSQRPQIALEQALTLNDDKQYGFIIMMRTEASGVSFKEVYRTISCESDFNPDAVGDSGQSRGLVQIHRPSHPHITDEQAFDPEFALNFIIQESKRGNQWKWTCWRNIFT